MGVRSLTGTKITLKASGTFKNELDDGTSVSGTVPNLNFNQTLLTGSSVGEVDRGWQKLQYDLGVGDIYILDLFNMQGVDIGAGVGKDALGQDVEWYEVVMITIVNDNEEGLPGKLEIYPSHDFGWAPIGSHVVANGGALGAQGLLMKYNPADPAFSVDPALSRRVTLHAVGGGVKFSVYILARHDIDESSQSSSSSSSQSSSSSSSSSSPSSSTSSQSSSSSTSSQSSQSTSSQSTSLSSQSTSSSSSKSASSVSSTSSSSETSSSSSISSSSSTSSSTSSSSSGSSSSLSSTSS